jgi:hypothetical protein
LSLGADSRQDYVTAWGLFPAQYANQPCFRNEYFTNIGNFSYAQALEADGISPRTAYQ